MVGDLSPCFATAPGRAGKECFTMIRHGNFTMPFDRFGDARRNCAAFA